MRLFHKSKEIGKVPFSHPAIDKLRRLTGEEWFPDPLSQSFIDQGHFDHPILTCGHLKDRGLITIGEVEDLTDKVIMAIVEGYHRALTLPSGEGYCSTGAVERIIKAEPIP